MNRTTVGKLHCGKPAFYIICQIICGTGTFISASKIDNVLVNPKFQEILILFGVV